VLREAAVRRLDEQLGRDPGAAALRFERASLLNELGRNLEARDEYIELLKREPAHRGALNNLGTLLHAAGYRTDAGTVYAEAVERHPDDPMSLVNLANMLLEDGDLDGDLAAARGYYVRALEADPDHPEAHQGLACLLAETGDEEGARFHRRKGFQSRPIATLPFRGDRSPTSLLQLVSTTRGNIPVNNFLDDRVFQTSVVFPEFYSPT
jgi:tetratricopeptide (TPR) repeat protein